MTKNFQDVVVAVVVMVGVGAVVIIVGSDIEVVSVVAVVDGVGVVSSRIMRELEIFSMAIFD